MWTPATTHTNCKTSFRSQWDDFFHRICCRFLEEVQQTAHVQLPHAIFMMKVILADNSTIPKDYKDVDFSVLTKNTGAKTIVTKFEAILRLGKKFNIFY